jgi:hypothetical protein
MTPESSIRGRLQNHFVKETYGAAPTLHLDSIEFYATSSPLVDLFDVVTDRYPAAAGCLGWSRDQARPCANQLVRFDRNHLLGRAFDHQLHAELDDRRLATRQVG